VVDDPRDFLRGTAREWSADGQELIPLDSGAGLGDRIAAWRFLRKVLGADS
jgi:hypothetical protein